MKKNLGKGVKSRIGSKVGFELNWWKTKMNEIMMNRKLLVIICESFFMHPSWTVTFPFKLSTDFRMFYFIHWRYTRFLIICNYNA